MCPVPGYDRHFTMLASYGIEMVTAPMREDGPDVAAVEALVRDDPSVKGMWIVPTYANPAGSVVTQEVASRLAAMPTAAPDFRIFWDNAYAFHHLTEDEAKSADILSLAAAAGHPHRPVMFASTSKITYAGAGVAFLAGSRETVAVVPRPPAVRVHRARQGQPAAARPVLRVRPGRARPHGEAPRRSWRRSSPRWTQPSPPSSRVSASRSGRGPPVATSSSLDVLDGCASRVVALAKEAGIALTPAGASFPHGNDPRDRNIRLAPSFPQLGEVETAMAGVATCVALAAAERLVGDIG